MYDKYTDGKLERESFLNEKKQYDVDMEKMEKNLQHSGRDKKRRKPNRKEINRKQIRR